MDVNKSYPDDTMSVIWKGILTFSLVLLFTSWLMNCVNKASSCPPMNETQKILYNARKYQEKENGRAIANGRMKRPEPWE